MHYSAEQKALLDLVRPDFDGTAKPDLTKLDTNQLHALASDHKVLPLVSVALQKIDSEERANDFEALRVSANEFRRDAFAKTTQALKLIDALESENIPVIMYKGPALASYAYQKEDSRQFTDIDLLISKSDFERTKNVLLSNNCEYGWDVNEKQEAAALKYYYEFPFLLQPGNLLFELHWSFIESFFVFDLDVEGVFERALRTKVYGKEVLTLSAEDYLLVLSSHGSKHFWNRLAWICDLDRLLRNCSFDPDLLGSLIKQTRTQRILSMSFELSQQILGTPIPENIKPLAVVDESSRSLARNFANGLFSNEPLTENWKEMAKLHLSMRENLSTKIRYMKRLIHTKAVDSLFLPMGRPQ